MIANTIETAQKTCIAFIFKQRPEAFKYMISAVKILLTLTVTDTMLFFSKSN